MLAATALRCAGAAGRACWKMRPTPAACCVVLCCRERDFVAFRAAWSRRAPGSMFLPTDQVRAPDCCVVESHPPANALFCSQGVGDPRATHPPLLTCAAPPRCCCLAQVHGLLGEVMEPLGFKGLDGDYQQETDDMLKDIHVRPHGSACMPACVLRAPCGELWSGRAWEGVARAGTQLCAARPCCVLRWSRWTPGTGGARARSVPIRPPAV